MRKRLEKAMLIGILCPAALAVAPGVSTSRVAAQAAGAEEGGSRICFRGRPLPACRSFWIVEMQGYTQLVQSSRRVSYSLDTSASIKAFEEELEWNVGHMVNVTPELAIGGVFTLGTGGGSGAFTGLKARARRWLSQNISLELEGGLLRSAASYPTASGVTADVRLNIRDQGSFFLRWDGLDLPRQDIDYGNGYGYLDQGGFQQAVSAGVGLGSVPTLIGTGALGLGYVILLGILLGSGYD